MCSPWLISSLSLRSYRKGCQSCLPLLSLWEVLSNRSVSLGEPYVSRWVTYYTILLACRDSDLWSNCSSLTRRSPSHELRVVSRARSKSFQLWFSRRRAVNSMSLLTGGWTGRPIMLEVGKVGSGWERRPAQARVVVVIQYTKGRREEGGAGPSYCCAHKLRRTKRGVVSVRNRVHVSEMAFERQ